jgi:hypothetical protein
MSRKNRIEPRLFPKAEEEPLELTVPANDYDEEASGYDDDVRGMFDNDEAVYRSTTAGKPKTVHYGQRKVEVPPVPRRRRSFEEILSDEEIERLMPTWEHQFFPNWKERTIARTVRAILEHNRRALAQGRPIFHPDTTMEIFPEELEGFRRFEAEAQQYRSELRGWGLLGMAPLILLAAAIFVIPMANLQVQLPPGGGPLIFFLGLGAFVAGGIGMFRTKYKYRHLDPTAGDPIRDALKGAAVTVAGAAAAAYVMHKLEDHNRS